MRLSIMQLMRHWPVTVTKSRYLLTKIIRLQLLTMDEESLLELTIKRENRRSKLYLPCCMPVVNSAVADTKYPVDFTV